MRDRSRRIGLFVGIVALVVVGAALAGFIAADPPATPTDATVDNEYYVSEEVLSDAELEERSGEIEFAAGPSRTVLIASNRPRSNLEPVVNALVAHGHEVRFSERAPAAPPDPAPIPLQTAPVVEPQPPDGADEDALGAELAEVDALLVIGGTQFSKQEIDGIEAFVEADGRVVVATDPPAGGGLLAPGGEDDAIPLLSRFGITVGDGYLYNMHENDANFQRVYADGSNQEFADDEARLVFDRATPIWSDGGTPIATAIDDTRYSTTRDADTYHVAVRNDNVVVLGDTNLFGATSYNRADNEQLLGGVLEFLTDGPEEPLADPVTPEEPMPPEEEPIPDDEPTPEEDEPVPPEGDSS